MSIELGSPFLKSSDLGRGGCHSMEDNLFCIF